jgi:subtilisin family serine protease
MEDDPMAQEKDERPSGAVKKTSDTGDDAMTKRAAGMQGRPVAREASNGGLIASPPGSRRDRYIIGVRTTPDGQPVALTQHSMNDVVEYLNQQENVEVVKRIKLRGAQPFTAKGGSVGEVVVAKIDRAKAHRLQEVAPPNIIIEPDSLLTCADYVSTIVRLPPLGTLVPLRPAVTDLEIRVLGERDQPLAKATVLVFGRGLPAQALTDETGTARVTFFGDSAESIQTLFVRAPSNHWDRLIDAPRLHSGANTVKLRPLSEVYANFPNERLHGWDQRLMGVGLSPSSNLLSGSGTRIGLIDSGCDNSHPLLRHVVHGRDFTAEGTDSSWTQDVLSHGTHCAGIINASSTQHGIIGCAPEAQLHIFKVSPGGRISDLLVALDECIERELDLINISVVSDFASELVSQKLHEARRMGIACIVAAGNTGGPLAYPATLPGVLSVAAVGKLREFPADSSHALSVLPQLIGADGIFPASFSSGGPSIVVSAPGVAVISTVPGGGYAAADGTSAAAAHVTGLAALILAHHPLFREGSCSTRSEHRVHALFELIRASAVPHFADPQRNGAGVPNLARVPFGHAIAMRLASPDAGVQVPMPFWSATAQSWPMAGSF